MRFPLLAILLGVALVVKTKSLDCTPPPSGYCMKGDKGERGENGLSGFPGLRGENGPPGSPGENGYPGLSGVKGERGLDGLDGRPGLPGLNGEPGFLCTPGEKGTSEIPRVHIGSGVDRCKDLSGDRRGIQGPPGLQGPRGPNGRDGLPGPSGPNGRDGLPGPKGEPGCLGRLGENGTLEISGVHVSSGEDGCRGTSTLLVTIISVIAGILVITDAALLFVIVYLRKVIRREDKPYEGIQRQPNNTEGYEMYRALGRHHEYQEPHNYLEVQ